MHCLVTGGTGFIGRHLVPRLDSPVVVGRNEEKIRAVLGDVTALQWNMDEPLSSSIPDGVDTVFHLAGESVFKGRWNDTKKDMIMDSRVQGTRHLIKILGGLDKPPESLVCASAIGYYGSRGDELLNEDSSSGSEFLAQVCRAWEDEAGKAEEFGTRVVSIRIGLVLGRDGGALPEMLLPFKLGLGGRIGSGRQYMSWIHIEDLIAIFLFAAGNRELRGPINAVAPNPVTNRIFTATLASVLHRPAFFAVPGSVLRITLGEFASVLLSSQRVIPEKLSRAGYSFTYPDLLPALRNLID